MLKEFCDKSSTRLLIRLFWGVPSNTGEPWAFSFTSSTHPQQAPPIWKDQSSPESDERIATKSLCDSLFDLQ